MRGGRGLWSRALIAGAAAIVPIASWAEETVNQIPQVPAELPPLHGPVLAYGLFNALVAVLIVGLLLREAWRTRSAFPLAFLIGGALAGVVEPVFDGNIHVWFVYPPGIEPSYHLYNVPYPWYVIPGNALLAGPVYWMYHKYKTGITAREMWVYFFVWWAFDAIQELPGTIMGAYVYYAPNQPFTVFNWPVWIGMLAALGFPLAGYAALGMTKVLSGARLWLAQAVVMPVAIYGCEVIAWPMWNALNSGASPLVSHLSALLSLAFTATAYYVLILSYERSRAAA